MQYIQQMFLDHFQNIYKSSEPSESMDFDDLFPHKITTIDNEFLCRIPDDEEIVSTLKQIPSSKAPRPDGFTELFYKFYWEVVKEDCIKVIKCWVWK